MNGGKGVVDEQESREREREEDNSDTRHTLVLSSPREYLMRHRQRGEKKFSGKKFWNERMREKRFRGTDDKSAGDN